MDEARALARRLAANAPLSLHYFKEIAYRGLEMKEPSTDGLMRHISDQVPLSEDAKEGPRTSPRSASPGGGDDRRLHPHSSWGP